MNVLIDRTNQDPPAWALHDSLCAVVKAARRGRKNVTHDLNYQETEDEVRDLLDRGFKIRYCPCLKGTRY